MDRTTKGATNRNVSQLLEVFPASVPSTLACLTPIFAKNVVRALSICGSFPASSSSEPKQIVDLNGLTTLGRVVSKRNFGTAASEISAGVELCLFITCPLESRELAFEARAGADV